MGPRDARWRPITLLSYGVGVTMGCLACAVVHHPERQRWRSPRQKDHSPRPSFTAATLPKVAW